MASERIANEYDGTRIANAVETLAGNLSSYTPGSPVTPTDAMKAKLKSQATEDRIADAIEQMATDITELGVKVKATYDETTALYAHLVDDIIYLDSHLYIVTSAIAVGDTIAVGTNISTNTGIEADTPVYIDKLPGSNSAGIGHKIINSSDAIMTSRNGLKFGSAFSVTDDSTNDRTIITPNSNILPTQDELGTVELGSTAAYPHAKGETFIWGGQFVKATVAISVGDSLTIGTNIAATTVSAMLAELNQNLAEKVNGVLTSVSDFGAAGVGGYAGIYTIVDVYNQSIQLGVGYSSSAQDKVCIRYKHISMSDYSAWKQI